MQKAELRYIKRKAIDIDKWNKCLKRASNAGLYAQPWYLDAVAKQWDALVYGDYQHIMPVPVNRKACIAYVAQPAFAQQLGIFPTPPPEVQQQFFEQLKSRFRLIDFQADLNLVPGVLDGFEVSKRRNRILRLSDSHETLARGYNENTRRNISKARKSGVVIFEDRDIARYIRLKMENDRWGMDRKTATRLEHLMQVSLGLGTGKLFSATGSGGNIIAGVLWVLHNHRAYYLNAYSTPEGKETSAAFALVDHFCRKSCGELKEIDFEGSEHPGVDRFYAGFGAVEAHYFLLRYNNLPHLVKLVKKLLRS